MERDIGQRLKEWRKGHTAEAAAAFLGMPVRTLNGIEQGREFRYAGMLALIIANIKVEDGQAK